LSDPLILAERQYEVFKELRDKKKKRKLHSKTERKVLDPEVLFGHLITTNQLQSSREKNNSHRI